MGIGPDILAGLIDRYAAGLILYARQWCDVAEDVIQESLVKLVKLPGVPESPAGWLYRTVRNGAISAGRQAVRRRRHEAAVAPPNWFEESSDTVLDGQTVAAALTTLSDDQREVIVAYLWGGLTFDEIAAITGVGCSTAHRRYMSGLATLRERIDQKCPTSTMHK